MRTEELTTGRFRLYAPGMVPLWALSSKHALLLIGRTFGFEQFQLAPLDGEKGPPSLQFGRGRWPAAHPTSPATIESLRISNDHLDLLTRAPEGHGFADGVLIELGRVCAEAVPERPSWVQCARAEVLQTVWAGHLDLSPDDLIDPRARALFLPTLKEGANDAGRRTYFKGLTLRVAPPVLSAELQELGLQFAEDEFKLEPRAGRPASERAWFSSSPLRSEDHLQLLEAVEAAYRG